MAENSTSSVTIVLPGQSTGDYLVSGNYESLLPAAQVLNDSGLVAVAENQGGAFRLRVAGVKNAEQLTSILGKHNIQAQQATNQLTSEEKHKLDKSAVQNWVRERTLRIAGFTYLLGDTSLILSGYLGKRYKEATAGLIYAGAGAVSAVYGDPAVSRQIKNVGPNLASFMTSMGADIGEKTALARMMPKNGMSPLARVSDFLYEHPSEIHNAIYAYGGTKLLQSGLEKRAKAGSGKTSGWYGDVASGALVTTGGAIAAFVSEDQKEEGQKPKNIMEWIKDKPLRLSGYLYTLNNFFLIQSAWQERKNDPKNKSYLFKFFTAGVFLIANMFLSVSSRDNTANPEHRETKNNIIGGMAAEVIATQPDEMRTALIHQVAGWLSQRHETRQDIAQWEKILKERVDALRSSRWVENAPAAADPKTQAGYHMTRHAQGNKTSSWQEKVNSPAELPPNTQAI